MIPNPVSDLSGGNRKCVFTWYTCIMVPMKIYKRKNKSFTPACGKILTSTVSNIQFSIPYRRVFSITVFSRGVLLQTCHARQFTQGHGETLLRFHISWQIRKWVCVTPTIYNSKFYITISWSSLGPCGLKEWWNTFSSCAKFMQKTNFEAGDHWRSWVSRDSIIPPRRCNSSIPG